MTIFTADLAVWLKPVSVLSNFTNNANTNPSHYPKSQHTCTIWTKTWSWGLLIHIFWYKNGLGVITTYPQFWMCYIVLSHNRNPLLLLLFFFFYTHLFMANRRNKTAFLFFIFFKCIAYKVNLQQNLFQLPPLMTLTSPLQMHAYSCTSTALTENLISLC